MAEGSRRFPPSWWAGQDMPEGYVVRDANGQAIAYLCSRHSEADARQAKVLTADEALAWNGQTFQDCDAQVRRPIKGKMKCLS
jgi:hypothetical protein